MSDLHGQFNMFKRMLKLINFNDNDQLYILGDIIDRGPASIQLYKYIKSKKNIELIMGNHEKMMVDAFKGGASKKNLWWRNGGNKTLEQYDQMTKEEQKEIRDYFESLPYFKIINVEDKTFVLCHAGLVFYDCVESLEDNIMLNMDDDMILWLRPISDERDDCIIVHGHTPTGYLVNALRQQVCPDYTMYKSDSGHEINIDCGCAEPEKLGCLRLDDLQEFYIKATKKEKELR